MMYRNFAGPIAILAGAFAMAFGSSAFAQLQNVNDDFTQASDANNWKTFNGACLTAGDGTGNIPACSGLAYYGGEALVGGNTGTLPDTAGNGALRFTNGHPGGYHQNGAIVSNYTFDTSLGLQITFKTVTYRGDSGHNGGSGTDSVFKLPISISDGADGISFYLMDGSKPAGIGAWGGSLGYSCSNTNPPYDGLVGGYLGLGIDEFGNFLNPGDNTATGPGLQANRIGLRGAGSISWAALNANYPTQYPTSLASTCNNAASTYSSATNSCSPVCASGTTYYAGTNTCNSCKTGTYLSSLNTCASCTYGTLNTTTGKCANACVPPTGKSSTYSTANNVCEICPSASAFNSTTNKCGDGSTPTTATPTTPSATTSSLTTATPTVPKTYALLATQKTCSTGTVWDYSANPASPTSTTTSVPDYNFIKGAYTVLDYTKFTIANESAQTRGAATPITYNLKITQDGYLSLAYSYNGGTYQPVISKQQILGINGSLPNSFRFGFAGSTGGSTNIHEILCFQATPDNLAATSVGVNAKEATKIASGTQAYLAYYYPSDWTGRLTASDLTFDGTNVGISSTANWDASCNLTGVASGKSCPTTTVAGPIAAQSPTYGATNGRNIFTWSGTAGTGFEWSALTADQQAALNLGDTQGSNRLAYLRGDRTNELYSDAAGAVHGTFRSRNSVLADIIDSSPTWVGPPGSPYTSQWRDALNITTTMPENASTAQTYSQFISSAQTRLNVVYAGANDGLLHGFRSGSFDASGNFVKTLNDGQEVLAYMPGAAISNTVPLASNSIHGVVPNPATPATPPTVVDSTLDYSSAQYSHNFYVDVTPDQDDLFYGGKWHTWLVGGLGAGGAALYALDVTDPTQFDEKNASSLVIGEWTPSSINCTNVSSCGNNLGNTYGVPVIRRLHNGMWAVIFGNGFGSSTGDAGIFVMTVSPTDGSTTVYYLSTGKAGSNGIAYVSPADLDGDHITDYVYAGDLLGNVWRFDLTSSNPSSWAAGTAPLFTAPGNLPITTKLLLAVVPQTTGPARLMVDFGTGRKFPQNKSTGVTYTSASHSLWGIWDWNMASWNAQAATANQLASLAAPQTVTSANLQAQTFTSPATGVRDVSATAICWAGSSACGTGNTQFGWSLALPGANEQVVFNPLLFQNAFVVNTTIPANNSPTSCQAVTDTGYTIAVSVGSGGLLTGFFKNYHDTSAAASLTNGVGTPFMVLVGGQSFLLTQTLGNGLPGGPLTCPPGSKLCSGATLSTGPVGKRLTWIQRR